MNALGWSLGSINGGADRNGMGDDATRTYHGVGQKLDARDAKTGPGLWEESKRGAENMLRSGQGAFKD
jgi:hypothetical protein